MLQKLVKHHTAILAWMVFGVACFLVGFFAISASEDGTPHRNLYIVIAVLHFGIAVTMFRPAMQHLATIMKK